MLLDEPTNNLDIDAVNWLEDFLLDFEGTVIVVSHDRHFLNTICTHIDHEIHRNYRLYPNNYIAMDELDGTDHTDHYTEDDVRKFKLYIQSQLAKIKIPNKDEEFLRERLLTMYANPARNYIEAVRG